MYDILLDACTIFNKQAQIYSLFNTRDMYLSVIIVDSPKELDYHDNFPMNLKVGEMAWCDYDEEMEKNITRVIRIQ